MSRTRSFRTITSLVAIAGTSALLLSGCGGGSTPTASDSPKVLTLASQLDNNSFDPALLQIAHNVQYWQEVYDTLLHQASDGSLESWLATEWSYNDDNTVLTLKLRDDVTFSDGTPFDADAVVANIEHFKQGTGGQNTFMGGSIDSVAAVDGSTVEITLSAPNPALLSYLAAPLGAMASPTALAAGDIANTPVGSGPYELDTAATKAGTHYEYERNPDYWNPDDFPFDRVTIDPMSDNTPRLNALKTGQINGALLTAASATEADASGLTVLTYPVNFLGLTIADRDGAIVPALADVKVRQAISMAVDRDAVIQALYPNGLADPTGQIFNPQSQAFVDDLDDAYPYDPKKAKQLMAEAGYADGFAVTMPGTIQIPNLDPIIDQYLGDIGITVTRESVPLDQFQTSAQSGKYAMYSGPLGSRTAWDDVLKYLQPKGASNPLHSTNQELDALIHDAQYATGEAAQTEAFQAINKWITDQAWFSVWMRPLNVYGLTKDVTATAEFGNGVPYLANYAPAK